MTITAKVICDSVANGIRLPTIQTRAPKFLDAEFEKHRMISSNSSSDRAIPLLKMLDNGYYLPNDIRLNQPGMQGDLLLDEDSKEQFWNDLKDLYGYTANILKRWDKVHKQHLNRYLMGFSWQNKIASATEWDNFFNLRLDKASDPAMYELAKCMKEAMDNSTPNELRVGEWHMPYLWEVGSEDYEERIDICLEDKIKVSSARCARVSYLNHNGTDTGIKNDIELHDRLFKDQHLSPMEHCATPMQYAVGYQEYEKGMTHTDIYGVRWSANFKGFIQYRQLLKN